MSELDALKLLRRIEEGVAGKSGEAFFRQIVRDIAGALGAHAAFTSRLLPDRRATMLAFWCADRYEKCLEYSLAGTPCEYVYRGEITAHSRDIGNVFPVDRQWFEELGVHSYLGIPIVDEHGQVHGHLAVMDRSERDWKEADVDVLRLFSLRTAVELERARAQRALEESNESLRHANEQLRFEVEQRLKAERQLEIAKTAAEAANHAKSVFISQMSHELRTPLNGILGYAQLLRREASVLSEQQRDGLDVIERSGEHLLHLVNDLLDLAKIESGRLDLRDERVDLAAVLQHVTELVRVRADKSALQFAVEMDDCLPRHVRSDARALRQILLNLLGNAVKFTDPGGRVVLRVQSAVNGTGRSLLTLEVCDSGIGIPREHLDRIFEPFHRIDDAARPAEGTGLGLPITRRLVEALTGGIAVASEVSRGTTFTVTLPMVVLDEEHDGSTMPQDLVGYEGRRRSILVADDDSANRALVVRLLERLGFDVRSAEDGCQALELIRRSPPDLLVTDLVMPIVDGVELTRIVRGELQAQWPVIAISASASAYTAQEALQAGCTAFLSKPLRLSELLQEIGRALGLHWRVASSQAAPAECAFVASEFALAPQLAAELQHLALLGDVVALMEYAENALSTDPRAGAFRSQLRSLADQYDTGAIRRLLIQSQR